MICKRSQQLTLPRPRGSLALALTLTSPIIYHGKRPLGILLLGLTQQHQLHRLTMTWAYARQITSNL
jgi:hypothetical protein